MKKLPPPEDDLDEDAEPFDANVFTNLPAVRKGLSDPNPESPSLLGFPPMFPIELAMRQYPISTICAAYGISKEQFAEIIELPVFQKAYENAQEMLAKDGASFKVKAKMQAEIVLDTAYKMVHNTMTPAAVRADMIKSIVRWAEYEPKKEQGSGVGNALQININLA